MRIGLIADTHDRLPAMAALVTLMAEREAAVVLHAGDYCSPFALRVFQEANLPLVGVFGHNDGDRDGLLAAAQRGLATELFASPHSLMLDERRILLVHDLSEASARSLESHDIVVFGSQHKQETRTQGGALLVNPGEGCGWIYGTPGAAVLDLATREIEFLSLTGAEWAF